MNLKWIVIIILVALLFPMNALSITPSNVEWSRTFGGQNFDWIYSVQQTSDGGFILTGVTGSYGVGNENGFDKTSREFWFHGRGVLETGVGNTNIWLIKLDPSGNEEWNTTFSGDDYASGHSVQQTNDGGYIIVGSVSRNGWLIKTDLNGKKEWDKIIENEMPWSVQQTNDGGFIVSGDNLIKISSQGVEEWRKSLKDELNPISSSLAYHGRSVQQTNDGGFIIAGDTSIDRGGFGMDQIGWLMKTDSHGNKEWEETFSTDGSTEIYSVQQTNDGGFITAAHQGRAFDVRFAKISSSGKEEWDKTFDGLGYDDIYSVQQMDDGGYIFAGKTSGNGGPFYGWLVKTNSIGTKEWEKTLTGSNGTNYLSIQKTNDGGFVVGGWTDSYGNGGIDAVIVKFNGSNKEGKVPQKEKMNGNINEVTWPVKSIYNIGETVKILIEVLNIGSQAQSFWVGYSVQDPSGKWWDVPPKQTASIPSGESALIQLEWQPSMYAPKGAYNAAVALWQGYDDSSNLMQGELDRKTKDNAFQLDFSHESITIQRAIPRNPILRADFGQITLVEDMTTSTKPLTLKIDGHVIDATNQKAIPNAKVIAKRSNGESSFTETTSDSSGHYILEYDSGPLYSPSPFSTYIIVCSADGYSNAYQTVKTDSEVKATQDIVMFPYKQPSSKSEDSLYDEVVNNLHITIKGPKNPGIGKESDYTVLLEPIAGTGIIEGNLLFAYDDKYINLYQERAGLFFKNPGNGEFDKIDLGNDYKYHDLNDFVGKETASLLMGSLNILTGVVWDTVSTLKPDLKLPPKGSAFYDNNNYDIFEMSYRKTESNPTTIGSILWDKDPSVGVKITLPIELTDQPEHDLGFYVSWMASATQTQGSTCWDSPDIDVPIKNVGAGSSRNS